MGELYLNKKMSEADEAEPDGYVSVEVSSNDTKRDTEEAVENPAFSDDSVDTKNEINQMLIPEAGVNRLTTPRISGSDKSEISGRWSGLKKKMNLVTGSGVDHSVRKTDFVLVYQKGDQNDKKDRAKAKKRNYFLRELRKEGLKIEFANLAYMKSEQTDGDTATDRKYVQFIKIGGTIEFFKKYGEILNVNMPLRPDLVNVINNIKQIKMDKYVAK